MSDEEKWMADSAVRKEDSGDEGQGPSPSQLTLLQRLQSSLLRDDPDSGMAGNPGAHMQQPAQMSVNPHPDHVTQVRMLVQQLKESLSNLMRISSANINHNAQIDTGSKTGEGKFKFDKALEDFFAITNQIERHLRTIAECVVQQKESNKYMPFPVSNKLDASGPVEMSMPNEVTTISYNQYMNIVKSQTNYCQSIQEILMEGAQKISHSESTSSSVAAPTPTS